MLEPPGGGAQSPQGGCGHRKRLYLCTRPPSPAAVPTPHRGRRLLAFPRSPEAAGEGEGGAILWDMPLPEWVSHTAVGARAVQEKGGGGSLAKAVWSLN